MKFRINFRPVLTDPLHGVRIVLYILLLTVVFLSLQRVLLKGAGWAQSFDGANPLSVLAQPALLAGGIEVQEGILHFNGKSGRGVWNGQITFVLMLIILTYVLGPALFAWGLHARARWHRNLSGNVGATRIAFALALGGLSLMSIIPAAMYAVISNATYKTMVHDCQVSAKQDNMSVELFQMGRRAQVIYFLPAEMGGGNQSWLARDGSGNPVIDISRIQIPTQSADDNPDLYGAGNGNRYSLRVERADSLTIRGVSVEIDVQGADGVARGDYAERVEVCIGVTPDRVNVVVIN